MLVSWTCANVAMFQLPPPDIEDRAGIRDDSCISGCAIGDLQLVDGETHGDWRCAKALR